MPIFSVLLIFFSYLQTSGLEVTVQGLALPSQNFCISLLDFSSHHLQLYKAIACGTPVKNSSYDILKIVSLWHLIIVSAGHFQVILWFLNHFKSKMPWFPHLGLILFCLGTGAQPPVIRAYFDLTLRQGSQQRKLWIPSEHCTLYSACFILLIFPSWTHSWSFLLSWLCGILILLLQRQSLLIQALGISMGVFPIACLFSSPHPLGFLFNLFFGPPLSLILFPLSLLMMIFPFLHYLTDPLVDGLLFLLIQLAGTSKSSASFSSTFSPDFFFYAWLYVLSLQALALLIRAIKVNSFSQLTIHSKPHTQSLN
jgi:hypothetical protein